MKFLKIDSIKDYIYHNSDKYVSLNLLNQLAIALLFISVFPFGCTIVGKAFPWSVILLVFTLAYIIILLLFNKRCNNINSFSQRFLINGVLTLFLSIYFLMLNYNLLSLKNSSKVSYFLTTLLIYIIPLMNTIFTIVNIKNGKYSSLKIRKKDIVSIVTIGVVIGVSLSRILKQSFKDNIKLDLAIFCMCATSFFFAFGIENFLKYYFCKKFNIQCDSEGNNCSELLIKSKKWTSSIPMIITILLLYLFVIIGIVIN